MNQIWIFMSWNKRFSMNKLRLMNCTKVLEWKMKIARSREEKLHQVRRGLLLYMDRTILLRKINWLAKQHKIKWYSWSLQSPVANSLIKTYLQTKVIYFYLEIKVQLAHNLRAKRLLKTKAGNILLKNVFQRLLCLKKQESTQESQILTYIQILTQKLSVITVRDLKVKRELKLRDQRI